MRRSPVEFLTRFASNAIRSRWSGDKLVKPMMASLYVTVKCNFRCTYCDDGSGSMYPELPEPDRLDTDETLKVIELMREVSPGFNITGGEPTLRSDIDVLYQRVADLGFMPVTFNTNAFLLDRHLGILRNIDYLVVSLDAVDQARGDALIDTGKGGQSRRVIANLDRAGEMKRAERLPFETIINTVILPETIDDAWDVWELCLARGWFWSPMPHIVGKYPNPGLVDNPAWIALVDEVMRAKKAGALIYGGMPALRAIRDFSRFECYPTTRPVIFPNGDLMYPCAPLQTVAANLLEAGSYREALRQGIAKHGPIPRCDARCHLGCYMETSTALTHPDEAVIEALRLMHIFRRRAPAIRRPLRRDRGLPPKHSALAALPSMPAAEVRRLRREGKIEHDFSSRLSVKRPRGSLPILIAGATATCHR